MDELNQKNEKELLAELIDLQKEEKKRANVTMIIAACVLAVIIIVSAIVVPKAVRVINETNKFVIQAQESVEKMNEIMSENAEGVADIITGIGEVDFDSLNQSIQALSDVMTPLAKIFNPGQ